MLRLRSLTLAIGGFLLASAAQADVITFGPGPYGTPVGPTVEGLFDYDTSSGGLFRDNQGNGDAFNMEGCSVCGGGVLVVKRNDAPGGLFTFDAIDVAFQFDTPYVITVQGYLGGVLQGTDGFLTASDSTYLTYASANLASVQIDELRVVLDATSISAAVIDNLVLTPGAAVPVPATLALLGAALSTLALRRRA